MRLRSQKAGDEKLTVLNETENPLLREWAKSHNSELNNPIPDRGQRLSLVTSIEKREAHILELQLMNARERAIKAPIRMLAPEILSRIFVEADRACRTDAMRISILQSCWKWLQIGLTTPSLWSTIRVSRCRHQDHDKECSLVAARIQRTVARAGTSMLDIFFTGSLHRSRYGTTENCDVIGFLSKRALQIGSIKSSDDAGSKLLVRAFRDGAGLPKLVSLGTAVDGDMFRGADYDENSTFQLFTLQTLSVHGAAMQNVLTLDCPLLVTLVLDMEALRACVRQFWKFLGSLPNLRSFTGRNVPLIKGDKAEPPADGGNLLTNLTYLSLATGDHFLKRWPDFPGNTILAVSPSVSDMEIVMDADIAPNPPLYPLLQVTKLTFKVVGKNTRGNNPVAVRRKRIREWLDAFPSARHLQIHVGYEMKAKVCDFLKVLLESSVKPGQTPCFPLLADLQISGARIDVRNLLEFSRTRSLVSDGGVLHCDKRIGVTCRISTVKCPSFPEVVTATFNEISEAITARVAVVADGNPAEGGD